MLFSSDPASVTTGMARKQTAHRAMNLLTRINNCREVAFYVAA
jgi:hypothetical protein